MQLDTLASQAVAQAHLLERAVNEPHGWTMTCGDFTVPAQRFVKADGISFLADFLTGTTEDVLTIEHSGATLSARSIDSTPGPVTVRWDVVARLMNVTYL